MVGGLQEGATRITSRLSVTVAEPKKVNKSKLATVGEQRTCETYFAKARRTVGSRFFLKKLIGQFL